MVRRKQLYGIVLGKVRSSCSRDGTEGSLDACVARVASSPGSGSPDVALTKFSHCDPRRHLPSSSIRCMHCLSHVQRPYTTQTSNARERS
jgi:hypothetical protein